MTLDEMRESGQFEGDKPITALTRHSRSDRDVYRDWRNPSCCGEHLSDYEDGRRVVIICNEEGLAEYKVMHPDGHLGAVED